MEHLKFIDDFQAVNIHLYCFLPYMFLWCSWIFPHFPMISHMFPMVSLDPLGRHLPGGLGCAGPGCAAPQPAPVATFGAADFSPRQKGPLNRKKGPGVHLIIGLRFIYIYIHTYIYMCVCVLVCNVYIYIHIETILSLLLLLLVVLILSLLLLQLQLLSLLLLLLLLWVLLLYIYVYMCVCPTSMKGWKASLQDFGGDMM